VTTVTDRMTTLFDYYSDKSRRDLMRKIVVGQFEFVSPYWNDISDSAKVGCRF